MKVSVFKLVDILTPFFLRKNQDNTVGGNIFAKLGSEYNIGSAEKPFANVYADNIVATSTTVDELVKASALDDNAGYLVNKLIAGEHLDKVLSDGGATVTIDLNTTGILLADGSTALTGNLSVDPGITIDGVDISAFKSDYDVHVGLPDVHHNRVTSGDDVITVDGSQGVSVALNATNPGLTKTGGLKLRLNPTNPGLVVDSSGLRVGTPGTLSVTSVNQVSTASHFHAITTTNDGDATPNTILKTDSEGFLRVTSEEVAGAVGIAQSLFVGGGGSIPAGSEGWGAGEGGSGISGTTQTDGSFRVISHTHDYDHVHVVINPTGSWSLDEQFGLDVDDNLLVRGWIVGKHAIQLEGATMLLHFDGPERSPDLSGQTRGHLGQVPTHEESITFHPGKFGMSAAIPEATTNLAPNPSFEEGLSYYADYSSGAATGTRSRVTDLGYAGYYSYKLSKTGGDDTHRWGFITSAFSWISGTTYTVSAWINITAISGGAEQTRLYVDGFGSIASATRTGITDGWERISVTFTASTTSIGYVYVWFDDCATGTMYVDALQVEESDYATAYCDGTLGAGHSWSGTAHQSSSVRNDGHLDYNGNNIINRKSGTFMAWVKPATVKSQMVMSLGASNWIRFRSDGVLDATWAGTGMGSSGGYVANTWYHVVLTWEDTSVKLYLDGVQIDSATISAYPSGATLSIGYYRPSDNQRWTGLIDDVVILDRAATEDEVRAVYESNAPVFAETSTWHWRAGRNRIWADAEGLWGLGANQGAIFGLYAGDEEDAAATKSWGGVSLSEGDLLIGNSTEGYLWWDNDAANKLKLKDAQIEGYDGGDLRYVLGNVGFKLYAPETATADDPASLVWYNLDNANEEVANINALATAIGSQHNLNLWVREPNAGGTSILTLDVETGGLIQLFGGTSDRIDFYGDAFNFYSNGGSGDVTFDGGLTASGSISGTDVYASNNLDLGNLINLDGTGNYGMRLHNTVEITNNSTWYTICTESPRGHLSLVEWWDDGTYFGSELILWNSYGGAQSIKKTTGGGGNPGTTSYQVSTNNLQMMVSQNAPWQIRVLTIGNLGDP